MTTTMLLLSLLALSASTAGAERLDTFWQLTYQAWNYQNTQDYALWRCQDSTPTTPWQKLTFSGECESLPGSTTLWVQAWCVSSSQHTIKTFTDSACTKNGADFTTEFSALGQCLAGTQGIVADPASQYIHTASKFTCEATPNTIAALSVSGIILVIGGLAGFVWWLRRTNRCFCCGKRCCRYDVAENEYEAKCCGALCCPAQPGQTIDTGDKEGLLDLNYT